MRRTTPLLFAAALAITVACSQGQGCGGCGALEPLPNGRFEGPRLDNAMNARLSPQGYAALNANWFEILSRFTGGTVVPVSVPCTVRNVTLLGDLAIADQGSFGCSAESCGQMDGLCDNRDRPLSLDIIINGMTLSPKAPDLVVATLNVSIATGTIYVSSVNRNHLACLFDSEKAIKCEVDLDTARDPNPPNTDLGANIRLVIDTKWDRLLSFEVASLDGAQSCSGSTQPPACIDSDDVVIQAPSGACQACDIAGWDAAKGLIINQLATSLVGQLQGMVDRQSCRPCGAGDTCPMNGTAQSHCQLIPALGPDAGYCFDSATGECLPRLLGVEGRMPVDTFFGALGAPPGAEVDFSIAAGGSASSDTGTNLAVMGGVQPTAVSGCVKPLTPPNADLVPPPDFDGEAPGPYDFALSASDQFLDLTLFQAHQAGALCATLTHRTAAQLSSGVVGTLLPSLTKLTGGEDVPMMVVLRPDQAPTATLGDGTLLPLITLGMKDLNVDVYARIAERQVRLFTLTVDVALPLGLTLENCTDVTPVLESLDGVATNIRVANGELLAEDPEDLAALVPLVLTLAEPQLAAGLGRFTLPELAGFQADLQAVRGVGLDANTGGFRHLAVFSNLQPAGAMCNGLLPQATAQPLSRFVGEDETGPLPPRVRVGAEGAKGQAQYSWRVDEGLWFDFQPADEAGLLTLRHPAFRWPGVHVVEVRARGAEARAAVSEPVRFEVVRDVEAPKVRFEEDLPAGVLRLKAKDDVTRADALGIRVRLGDGDWRAWTGPMPLEDADAAGVIVAEVVDESGKRSEATWRAARVALREDPALHDGGTRSSCAAVPGPALAAALMGLLLLPFRRRR